jgi:hypothetical protein
VWTSIGKHVPDYDGIREEGQRYVRFGRYHWPAVKVRQEFPEIYRHCKSVAIVRNPWSWVLSAYHYARGRRGHPFHQAAVTLSFEDFVVHYAEHEKRDMTHFVCDRDGRIIVDRVLRFESFAQEVIPALHELFGYTEIPHLNQSRASELDFCDMYTLRSHRAIVERYRRCIDTLNYQDIEAAVAYRLLMKHHFAGCGGRAV